MLSMYTSILIAQSDNYIKSNTSMIYDYQLREFPTKKALADPLKININIFY